MRIGLAAVSALFLFSLNACNANDGPVERAGKNVDQAVENVKDGDLPFAKKGPMEKAGEKVDEAVDNATDGR